MKESITLFVLIVIITIISYFIPDLVNVKIAKNVEKSNLQKIEASEKYHSGEF